jgi:hypothetical protein
MATSYGLDRSGLEPRQRLENLFSPKLSRPALEPTQPSIQWVPSFFPMGKVAGMWSSPLTATHLHLLPSQSALWCTVQVLVWATNNVVKS